MEEREIDVDYYKDRCHLTKIMWKNLLKDPTIFTTKDIEVLKQIYSYPDHGTTCKELGKRNNCYPSSYNFLIVHLSRRILQAHNVEPKKRNNGKEWLWPVLFYGKELNNGLFRWKIKKELAEALCEVYPEIDSTKTNKQVDTELINDINNDDLLNDEVDFCYSGTSRQKGTCLIVNNIKVYKRDRQISTNALAHAHFQCEINNEHPSFLRKKSKVKYTEPHHLVPMSYSDRFDVSLDVEENIVSLCSNCHNQFHYGDEVEKLLSKLYNERKADLELVGIYISFDELVEMYK